MFVMFKESWCPYCYKIQRTFESGASFFRGRVVFLEVDCGIKQPVEQGAESPTAFCDEEGIEEYPTLRLYTRNGAVRFDGDRSLAGFERFFHQHRHEFPTAPHPTAPAAGDTSLSRYPLADQERDEEGLEERVPPTVSRRGSQPPPTPAAESTVGLGSRIGDLENRMDRIESMLQEMMKHMRRAQGRDEL